MTPTITPGGPRIPGPPAWWPGLLTMLRPVWCWLFGHGPECEVVVDISADRPQHELPSVTRCARCGTVITYSL